MEKLILKRLEKSREKLLVARGASPADMLHGQEKFDVLDCIMKYEVSLPRLPTRLVSINKQIRALDSIIANPIRANYVLCISSFPSDSLGKFLAMYLLDKALQAWSVRHKPGKTQPLWHKVYGGLGDTLRDRSTEENPSLIVISNVNETSSGYKLEKVRDLLEKYSAVPRIIVTAGMDPITFFSTKLFYPLNAGIFLGPKNRVDED